MDIRSTYATLNRLQGFSEYRTPKFYQQTRKSMKKLPVSFKTRTSFLNDIIKNSKIIPGPGQYKTNPQQSKQKKRKAKINFKKLVQECNYQGRETYLDKQLKRKSSMPAIGKYDVLSYRSFEKSKSRRNEDEVRKKSPLFRSTVLDDINVDNVNVAPGSYELSRPIDHKNKFHGIYPEHKTKRATSLPKLPPSSCDYNPIPILYDTFAKRQSLSSLSSNSKSQQFVQKPKNFQTIGPGPKYSLIIDWAIKKGTNGKQIGQNYLNKISSSKSQSIYH